MADKHCVLQSQSTTDLHDVVGVAGKRRVLGLVIGRKVGSSRADVVEKHHLEVVFELRRHEAPHVLIAAEAVREDHRPVTASTHVDVVSRQDVQWFHPLAAFQTTANSIGLGVRRIV